MHRLAITIALGTVIAISLIGECQEGDFLEKDSTLLESLSTDFLYSSGPLGDEAFISDMGISKQELEDPRLTFNEVAILPQPDLDQDLFLASDPCGSENDLLPYSRFRARDEDQKLCPTKEPTQALLNFPDLFKTLGRYLFGQSCPAEFYTILLYCSRGPDHIFYRGPPYVVWAKYEDCYPGNSCPLLLLLPFFPSSFFLSF